MYVSKKKLEKYVSNFPKEVIDLIFQYLDICNICDLLSIEVICENALCRKKMCMFCVHTYSKCKTCGDRFCGIYCFQKHRCEEYFQTLEIIDSGQESE